MARGYEAVHARKLDAEGVLVPLFFGFLFGFAMVKGVAYLPSVIYGQLQWDKFLLVKFYLSALSASLIGAAILSLCGSDAAARFQASRITVGPGFVSVAIGASLAGLGMALTGTEPAAAFTQTGTGVISGLYVLIGGLLAVLAYGFLYDQVFSKIDEQGRPSKSSLDEIFGAEYWQVALPLGLSIAALCWALETKWSSPWTQELPSGVAHDNGWLPHFKTAAWNVYYVGAFVGLLQIPLRASLNCLLDTTDAFVCCVTVPLKWISDNTSMDFPAWFKAHGSPGRLWGVFFFGAAALGGFLAAQLGGMLAFEHGFGIKWCLLGGFCLVLGALICGNCPTGLIVSGSSDLNVQCMLGAVLVLFCGMAAAHILKGADIHPEKTSTFLMVSF